MTVSLKNLKIGDTVHFRCGGSLLIKMLNTDGVVIKINNSVSLFKDGLLSGEHPFDVISITLAPEPVISVGYVNVWSNFGFGTPQFKPNNTIDPLTKEGTTLKLTYNHTTGVPSIEVVK